MTNEELQELLEYWQGELRLRDWDITARFARVQEMIDVFHLGGIDYQSTFGRASVKIISHDDYDHSGLIPYDAEVTLVHELLHLHTFRFAPNNTNKDEELALNVLASALVRLKRNAK